MNLTRSKARARAALGACGLAAGVLLAAPALAQTSPAKKELVARVLKLQQPGIEAMGRVLAEQPAQQLFVQARNALQRVPAEKRDALAREIEGDFRKYAEEAVPVVRDRAVALAPSTIGPLLEQRFTEDELRQIIAMLENPVNAKYQAIAGDMQKALGEKLVAETRGAVEPKVQALQQSINNRLTAAVPKTN